MNTTRDNTPTELLPVKLTTGHTADWYCDHSELCAFAAALVAGETFGTQTDLLYYVQKPHKWTREHWLWCASGRPEAFPASDLDFIEAAALAYGSDPSPRR